MTPTRDPSFGERLKLLREAKELSQSELGSRAGGVVQGTISNWEKDLTSPKVEQLPELARALEVSLMELVSGRTDEQIDIEAMRDLIEKWTPAFAAIRQAVATVAKPVASKREG